MPAKPVVLPLPPSANAMLPTTTYLLLLVTVLFEVVAVPV